MIKDPIEIISNGHWRAVAENNLGETIFIRNNSALSLVSVHRGVDLPHHITQHFVIFKSEIFGISYRIGEKSSSKEEFTSFISVRYPNYLEWLLFHPEWLC